MARNTIVIIAKSWRVVLLWWIVRYLRIFIQNITGKFFFFKFIIANLLAFLSTFTPRDWLKFASHFLLCYFGVEIRDEVRLGSKVLGDTILANKSLITFYIEMQVGTWLLNLLGGGVVVWRQTQFVSSLDMPVTRCQLW